MGGIKKQFYFPDKNMDVYEYIMKQSNASQFVIQRVRDYMSNNKFLTEADVIRLIKEYGGSIQSDDKSMKDDMLSFLKNF